MKKCMNCGAENPDGRRWCRNCLKELKDSQVPVKDVTLSEKESTDYFRRVDSIGRIEDGKPDINTTGDKTQSPVSGFANQEGQGFWKTADLSETDYLIVDQPDRLDSEARWTGSVGNRLYGGQKPGQTEKYMEEHSDWRGVFSAGDPVLPPKNGRGRQKKPDRRTKRISMRILGIVAAGISAMLLLAAGLYFGWNALISVFGNQNQRVRIIVPEDLMVSSEDVCYEEGQLYMDSQIVMVADTNTDYKAIETLAAREGGEIVGYISFSGDYQIDFPKGKTYDELSDIISRWDKEPYVRSVSVNHVYEMDLGSVNYLKDLWLDTSTGQVNTEWSEENPNGNNWWAEAIGMPSVWEMDIWDSSKIEKVEIGAIDSVFAEEHKDLEKVISRTWNNEFDEELMRANDLKKGSNSLSHGTHVSGLIAAEMGNKTGIAGVASCADPELYCFSFRGTYEEVHLTNAMIFKYAIALMLEQGVSVINISLGPVKNIAVAAQQGVAEACDIITQFDQSMSAFLKSCISYGYEFLIVKSAGNASGYYIACEEDSKEAPYGYREVSSETPGAFRIDASAKYNYLAGITDPEVRKRIIIVGAAELDRQSHTGYSVTSFSCIDADVYAPGENILSLVYGENDTDSFQGTSMSTPIVTGMVGLLWSVNPNLSAVQVRQIILDSAGPVRISEKTGGTVTLPDAQKAVQDALGTEGNAANSVRTGILMGSVYQVDDGDFGKREIPGAKVTVSNAENGVVAKEVILGDSSEFEFILPAGSYVVTVEAEGYSEYEVSVNLSGRKTEYLSIQLYPKEVTRQLVRVDIYHLDELEVIELLHYNEEGLLTSMDVDYVNMQDADLDFAFRYDSEGRLLSSDHDEFWLFYGDDEYIYNADGQLTGYRFYWGGEPFPHYEYTYEYNSNGHLIRKSEFYPNYDTNTLELMTVYSFSYVYDNQGRIVERHRHVEWIDSDYNYTTQYGSYPYSEYAEVTRYTYDAQGRVKSEQTAPIPESMLDLFDNPDLKGYTECLYYHDYRILNVCILGNESTILSIKDVMGHDIWDVSLSQGTFQIEDGYIVEATDAHNEYRYEFIYEDSTDSTISHNANDAVADYAPVLEELRKALSGDSDYRKEYVSKELVGQYLNWGGYDVCYSYCDLNSDGIEELIIGADPGSGQRTVYDVFTSCEGRIQRILDTQNWGFRVTASFHDDGTISVSQPNGASFYRNPVYTLPPNSGTAVLEYEYGMEADQYYYKDSEGMQRQLSADEYSSLICREKEKKEMPILWLVWS